jgi:hypothetical protein
MSLRPRPASCFEIGNVRLLLNVYRLDETTRVSALTIQDSAFSGSARVRVFEREHEIVPPAGARTRVPL